MRIATTQLFNRPTSLMAQLTAHADKTQTSIATTKKYTTASENAGAYLQLQGLKQEARNDSAYASNINMARGVLEQVDSTLGDIENQLQRVLTLASQASTGTTSDDNRVLIAADLEQISEALFSLANARDVRGNPLFGGATGEAAYTRDADGVISFAGGTEGATAIPISHSDTIQANIPGNRLFGSEPNNMFNMLSDLSKALRAGGDIRDAATSAMDAIKGHIDELNGGRAIAGSRAARLEVDLDRLSQVATDREIARSELEDTDIASAVTELQKTLTVLQATQASFAKLTSMSLFDYLR